MHSLGDLDWHWNETLLNHGASANPCWRCPCTLYDFHNFTPSSPWRSKFYTNNTWTPPKHPRYEQPGAHLRTAAIDCSHTLDKGVTQGALGNLFKDLVYGKVLEPRGTLADNNAKLFSEIKQFQKDHKTPDRIQELRLQHYVEADHPHQEFPNYNPGNMSKTRCLVPFGLKMARLHNSGSPKDRHRMYVFEHLQEIYQFILTGPRHPSDAEAAKFVEHVEKFLHHWSWLSWDAHNKERKEYNVTIKYHLLLHLAHDARFINPRAMWTLDGEDWVGHIAKICKGSTNGVERSNIPRAVLEKWVTEMHLEWKSQKGECG